MHAFDGQTEFSSLDRVCIPCTAVKQSICKQWVPRVKILGLQNGPLRCQIGLTVIISGMSNT